MSQKTTNARKKNQKKSKRDMQKQKSRRNLGWILAGCIIIGGSLGFLLGKFWLYPNYKENAGYESDSDSQTQWESENQELQELNRQLEEDATWE